MVKFAGIKFLNPSPEVFAKYPAARQKITVVEVKHLKLGTPGLGYFKPSSEHDFSESETYRFCDVTSSKLPLCYVVALGETGDAVRSKLSQRRIHVPSHKFGDDVSGFHTGTDSKNNAAKNAERKARKEHKKALSAANLSNMQDLMLDSENWLNASPDVDSQRQRSVSLDSAKRKSTDGEQSLAPARKRSLSNERVSIDTTYLETVKDIKKCFEEQCRVFNKELEEEKALRRQAQQELSDLRKAWREDAQENKKDRDELMGVIIALKTRTLANMKQKANRPAEERSIVEQMDEMYPNGVSFHAPKPHPQPLPVCLGLIDKRTRAKLHCNSANYRDAFNSSKPIEWAKHMLLGIYGSEAKLMRYHSPRALDDDLRRIPEGEYSLISDAYDKWLTDVLHLQKGSPVYTSFSKGLGSTLGSAGRSLYVSPRTGNGSKMSSSSRKKKELSKSNGKPSDDALKDSGTNRSRTPSPVDGGREEESRESSPSPSHNRFNPPSSTEIPNVKPGFANDWNESSINGALDVGSVSPTQALKMLGKLSYPKRNKDISSGSDLDGEDIDGKDDSVTDFEN